MTKATKEPPKIKLPNVKMANQCKVCKLVHFYPQFWIEIHDKVLKENNTRTSVRAWANAKIDLLNAQNEDPQKELPHFTDQNFAKHFTKHINFELQQALIRQRILVQNSRLNSTAGFSENEKAIVEEYGEDLLRSELDEYKAIAKMIGTLEKRLWAYDKRIQDRTDKGRVIDIDEIGAYQKQVESLVKLKLELSKLRNSSVVAGMAVEAAVELAVSYFVEAMMQVTEEAQTILSTEMQSSTVPMEVTKLIRGQLADSMKSAVPLVVEQISKDYKIK